MLCEGMLVGCLLRVLRMYTVYMYIDLFHVHFVYVHVLCTCMLQIVYSRRHDKGYMYVPFTCACTLEYAVYIACYGLMSRSN